MTLLMLEKPTEPTTRIESPTEASATGAQTTSVLQPPRFESPDLLAQQVCHARRQQPPAYNGHQAALRSPATASKKTTSQEMDVEKGLPEVGNSETSSSFAPSWARRFFSKRRQVIESGSGKAQELKVLSEVRDWFVKEFDGVLDQALIHQHQNKGDVALAIYQTLIDSSEKYGVKCQIPGAHLNIALKNGNIDLARAILPKTTFARKGVGDRSTLALFSKVVDTGDIEMILKAHKELMLGSHWFQNYKTFYYGEMRDARDAFFEGENLRLLGSVLVAQKDMLKEYHGYDFSDRDTKKAWTTLIRDAITTHDASIAGAIMPPKSVQIGKEELREVYEAAIETGDPAMVRAVFGEDMRLAERMALEAGNLALVDTLRDAKGAERLGPPAYEG